MNASSASLEAVPQLARVIPRDAHPISRSRISPEALRVLYRLKDAGYQAFLVGGCVRDLIIGEAPKDFDVVTDALPEELKRLFRNCRLVGRRFRLAHIMFGREVIEVATFRASSAPVEDDEPAPEDPDDGETGIDHENPLDALQVDDSDFEEPVDLVDEPGSGAHAEAAFTGSQEATRTAPRDSGSLERVVNDEGRIVRDNVYGTIDDDVWRRDFTANALYYNIADFSVWDYVGGFEDTVARRLRLIGDPETRYREDPVRMLRAARFEAKLHFTLDAPTAAAIETLADTLAGVPPARLFDETLKLFLGGHGARSYEVLQQRGLLQALMPPVGDFATRFAGSPPERMLVQALHNTDARVAADRPVSPTFLFSVLFYGPVGLAIESAPRERWHDIGTILDAVDAIHRQVHSRISIPRRFSLGVREMFALQPRLESPRGRRALRMLEHPRFRAAYDLLELRAQFGMASQETVDWWTAIQQEPDSARRMELAAAQLAADGSSRSGGGSASGGRGPRRRSRRGRGGGGRSAPPGA